MCAAGDARKAVIAEAQADPDNTSVHPQAGTSHQKAKGKAADQASLPPVADTCTPDSSQHEPKAPNGDSNHDHTSSDAPTDHHHTQGSEAGSQKMNCAAEADHARQEDNAYMPSFRFQEGANGMGGVLALPMQPITLAFKDVNYFVDAPASSAVTKVCAAGPAGLAGPTLQGRHSAHLDLGLQDCLTSLSTELEQHGAS